MSRGLRSGARGLIVDGTGIPAGTPSNIVAQYFATTWSQGDATWSDDEGSNDMSMTGDPQATTLSDGQDSIDFDGTDDHGSAPLATEINGGGLQTFSLEVTYEYSTTGNGTLLGVSEDFGSGSSVQQLLYSLDTDEGFNTDNGNFLISLQDQDQNLVRFAPTTNPNLNDGNRHDVSIIINDSANNDVTVIIDGSTVSLSFANQESPDNFADFTTDAAYSARNNKGTIDDYSDVEIGAIRYHDTNISSQTIDEY